MITNQSACLLLQHFELHIQAAVLSRPFPEAVNEETLLSSPKIDGDL
jgi:hypothetical protein